jgi:hypothetical protein
MHVTINNVKGVGVANQQANENKKGWVQEFS